MGSGLSSEKLVPIGTVPFHDRNLIDHMMVAGTHIGNERLYQYLNKLARDFGVARMGQVVVGPEQIEVHQTYNFEKAFAPGWTKSYRVALVPVELRFPHFRHENAIVCQLLPDGTTIQCLHFEPNGYEHWQELKVVEDGTIQALQKMCRRQAQKPFQLDYWPITQSCPQFGPQQVHLEAFSKIYDFPGLCVMHCMNTLRQTVEYMSQHPGVFITPNIFVSIVNGLSDTVVKDMLLRTHSLMALGGYRNNQLHPSYLATKRMTARDKQELLRRAGLKSVATGYVEASNGLVASTIDYFMRHVLTF